jgi:hypothetical protein
MDVGYTIQYVEKDPKNKDHQTDHNASLTFVTEGRRNEDQLLTKCGNTYPITTKGEYIAQDMQTLNALKGKQVIVVSQGRGTKWYSNLDRKDHINALLFYETRNKCAALKTSNGDKIENFCKVKEIGHPVSADKKIYLSTDYLIFPTMTWKDCSKDVSARIELSTIMNLYKIIRNDGLEALHFCFTARRGEGSVWLYWQFFEKQDVEVFLAKMVLKAGTFAAIVAALCYYCKSKK